MKLHAFVNKLTSRTHLSLGLLAYIVDKIVGKTNVPAVAGICMLCLQWALTLVRWIH